MIDIAHQIGAIDRSVSFRSMEDGSETVSVLARRRYKSDPEDLWDALTNPERIPRWFLPISGELREGGTFQLEGNAGGRILECLPPSRLKVTFGGDSSLVELRLTAGASGTTSLELEHTVPLAMAQSGAGALWVGPGWDGMFLALGLFVDGIVSEDPAAAALSPEALAFSERSVRVWAETVRESGTATPEQLAEALAISLAQFAPGTSDPAAS
ncbi:ATPase [Arthrobacter sp. MYb227]|uniref:SRPBCC domain-containing protein n=1 Tax=Arthrobacter sp. MYb227 TaxID=1848601 RepID=UPI000CFE1150|nr:SRPBCC domain-containing protein [Arthrobacter sp. MYb227]PQZ94940.1 ATPase [Arthrobacter sp. MYb227]